MPDNQHLINVIKLQFPSLLIAIGFLFLSQINFSASTSIFNLEFLSTYLSAVFCFYFFSKISIKNIITIVVVGSIATIFFNYANNHSFIFKSFAQSKIYWEICTGTACIVMMLLAVKRSSSIEVRYINHQILLLCVFAAMIIFICSVLLYSTALLHPITYDYLALKFDGTLGFQPSQTLGLILKKYDWMHLVALNVYELLVWFFFGIACIQIRQQKLSTSNQPSLLLFWTVTTISALVFFYHVFPVAGPRYFLSDIGFPTKFPSTYDFNISHSIINTAFYRNGMPSLHFGGALALWLVSRKLNLPYIRATMAVFLGLTFVATLGLGEHYLIDLVVAVPFTLTMLAISTTSVPWDFKPKQELVIYGSLMYFGWLFALWFGINIFRQVPGLSWAAIIASTYFSIKFYKKFDAYVVDSALLPTTSPSNPLIYRIKKSPVIHVWSLFALSGFAALIYEVMFSKSLALTFGSTATAMNTVLATYMGGIALGSWLGGKLAEKSIQPLKLYAICEFAIGIYCLITPILMPLAKQAYIILASNLSPDLPILNVYRVLLGVLVLLPPTLLMGVTMPLLVKHLNLRKYDLGISVSALYSANTVGAAVGALLTGYFFIPLLGLNHTTLFAVAINLIVTVIAINLSKKYQSNTSFQEYSSDATSPIIQYTDIASVIRMSRFAIIALTVCGFTSLGLEVLYMHMLAIVAGNSTYAFSLMLFTFLIGLGLGAIIAKKILQHSINMPAVIATVMIALSLVIFSGIFIWAKIPEYLGSFVYYPIPLSFGERELIRAISCFAIMFPPAFIIGVLYPLLMSTVGAASPLMRIQKLGTAASLNTLGNILGVILMGFYLLPHFGALKSIQLLGTISILMGLLAWIYLKNIGWLKVLVPISFITIIVISIQPKSFNYDLIANGANVYFRPQLFGKIIEHTESIDGGLTSIALNKDAKSEIKTLLTNGKFQGNNSRDGEMQAQVGFALAPLAHTDNRGSALIIGYGTGMSARTLYDAGFKHLDIAELSQDIVHMANKHFSDINKKVSDLPGVNTYFTDGRNFLLLQNKQYDLISMEITSIWFAGAASLYNQEFYELAKQHLNAEGVLQQWVQLHHLSRVDLLYILGSVRSEFKYVWVYYIGGQGIIVASNSDHAQPNKSYLDKINNTVTLKPLLDLNKQEAKNDGPNKPILNPEGVENLLLTFGQGTNNFISTDNNLVLEYSTPKGNALHDNAINQVLDLLAGFQPK